MYKTHTRTHIEYKVKLTTGLEGDQLVPFSIATTPRCRRGCDSSPWLLHFTLDTYLILLSVQQGGNRYHFKSLWYDATWDEPWSPGPLANTLPTIPMR